MSFFGNALGGNPFSTPVGGKIEQATDGTLASENWGLNMEICDLVNETEDGPRDAVKAIRKRLQQNAGKNYTVVMYTLTVLETCVKNCGKRFHILICNKDFVSELVKLIGPKNDPPTAVQEKVLSLIQSWADAFRNQPEMAGVVAVYQDLLAKGIEFPATDLDAMAPIHTPQRSVESELPIPIETQPQQQEPSPGHVSTPTGGTLTPEQRAKLQSELDIVQNNMGVFSELLSELKPGYEQPDELELLQELHVTCQSMQERLVELISKLSNDELTAEFLRINDDLNNLFLRYNRWEKNHENGGGIGVGGGSSSSGGGRSASEMLAKAIIPPPQQQQTKQKLTNDDSLISFDEDHHQNIDDLSQKLSKLGTGSASASNQLSKIENVPTTNPVNKNDEFDMFAQSRNVSYENSKTSGSTYKDNLESDQLIGGLNTATRGKQTNPPDLEFDEMANWLGQTTGGEESVTSSEFERFLAERAAAAEQLPTVTGSTNDSSNSRKNRSKDETKGLYAS